MIYPRLFHRHIAITALYLLLTLGVLGLIVILCTFNDTEHTYLFKSGPSRSNEKQLPESATFKYMPDQEQENRLNYGKTIIVTTPRHNSKAENNLKKDSSDEGEQQHIYIDELYTETTKPKRVYDNYINYRKMKITAVSKKTKNNSNHSSSKYNGSESKEKIKKFRKLHVDDDTDADTDNDDEMNAINNDNEIVASGSGDGSQLRDLFKINANENKNNNFDLETQRFIKRIGLRLSQLSKRNTTDHSYPSNKNRRNKKLFESKLNYYRSLEVTTPLPLPFLKLKDISKWSEESGAFPLWTATQTKTRRVIGNERKSAERSRQLLLCEKGKSGGGGGGEGGGEGGGGELCRMLFKET